MNFGPLNRDGGWRRLNVAVSRARCEMMVFSALRPDQLDLNRTKAEGVAALRKFLEYAEGRTRALEAAEIAAQSDADGIARSIQTALKEHGYEADLNVGRSEYRIDIGIIDPNVLDTYRLGILLDGPSYGAAKTTRDRELAQIGVLQGLGWNILRIWTMDWWDNRDKELGRILKALNELPAPPVEEKAAPVREIPAAMPEPEIETDLPVYQAAVLPMELLTPEDFLEPRYFAAIQRKIETVIRAEAPVSLSLLTRRIIQSYGISRAGSRIQTQMERFLTRMKLTTTIQAEGKFCWSADQDPERYREFRICGEGDSRRDIRDVPVQEIANAMCAVLSEQVSMNREDLLRETANKLGYTRLGSNVLSSMNHGFAYAETPGAITVSTNGTIILSK
jgi:very-short-patch-repair endonuclease